MKRRWLAILFVVIAYALAVSAIEPAATAPDPPLQIDAGGCDEWLHFAKGDVAVCYATDALFVEVCDE